MTCRGTSRRTALTLLELMVVLTLLGLVAALTVPRLTGALDRPRLRSATHELEQALRLARCTARARWSPAWLVLVPDSGRFRVATSATLQATQPIWRELVATRIEAAAFLASGQGGAPAEPFAVRVLPSGVTPPWALELRAGHATRVVWSDGLDPALSAADDRTLREHPWEHSR